MASSPCIFRNQSRLGGIHWKHRRRRRAAIAEAPFCIFPDWEYFYIVGSYLSRGYNTSDLSDPHHGRPKWHFNTSRSGFSWKKKRACAQVPPTARTHKIVSSHNCIKYLRCAVHMQTQYMQGVRGHSLGCVCAARSGDTFFSPLGVSALVQGTLGWVGTSAWVRSVWAGERSGSKSDCT